MKNRMVKLLMVVLCLSWPAFSRDSNPNPLTKTSPQVMKPETHLGALTSREIEKFYQVSETVYRGGQPTSKGMLELKSLGVKTLVSLRSGLTDDQDRVGTTGLNCLNVPLTWNPFRGPKDESVVRFLKYVTDPANQPVFVHCRLGVDRTGLMMAAYRIVIQGWEKDRAIAEMQEIGLHSHFFKFEKYLKKMDVKKIRQEIQKPSVP